MPGPPARPGPEQAEPGHGEDHDRALQDLDDLDRHVAEELDGRPGRGERAEDQRGEQDADRRVAPEQRDGDAGEAVAGRKAGDEAMDDAESVDSAGKPADGARQQHDLDDDGGNVDADRAAEDRVEADEAGLETERRETVPQGIGQKQRAGDGKAEIERRRRQQARQFGRCQRSAGVAELAEPGASSGPLTS